MIILTLARKPCSESSVAANVLKWGTGGLNIDGARISTGDTLSIHTRGDSGSAGIRTTYGGRSYYPIPDEHQMPGQALGRWPANLILGHLSGCVQVGQKRVWANQSSTVGSGKGHLSTPGRGIFQEALGGVVKVSTAGTDGMETVTNWNCQPGCPVADLDVQSGERTSKQYAPNSCFRGGAQIGSFEIRSRLGSENPSYSDTGGASRFFKQVGGTKSP